MISISTSPMIFPSDMDSSKLTADPNFKLPEPIKWTDHDYCTTMMDESISSLTDLPNLEPVNENDIHVFSHFIGPTISTNLDEKPTTDNYTRRLTLLSLSQSMVNTYTLLLAPSADVYNQSNNNKIQNISWINLCDALDVVEKDMKKNGHGDNSTYFQDSFDDGWSYPDDHTHVPDLVHSICSSPSLHSLMGDLPSPSTSVLFLETSLDNQFSSQQIDAKITNTMTSLSSRASIVQQPQDKKKNTLFRNWIVKKKQDCFSSLSNVSRNFRRWVKN